MRHIGESFANGFVHLGRCMLTLSGLKRMFLSATLVVGLANCSWAAHTLVPANKATLDTANPVASGLVTLSMGNSHQCFAGVGTKDTYTISVPANKIASVIVQNTGGTSSASMSGILVNVGNFHGDYAVNPERRLKFEKTDTLNVWITAIPYKLSGYYASEWIYKAFSCRYYYKVTVEYYDKTKPVPTHSSTVDTIVTFVSNGNKDVYCSRFSDFWLERGDLVMKSGQPLLANAPEFTRSGYKFLGWYDKASGGTKITESYKVPKTPITLYAHWGKITEVKVYFDSNGGYGSMGPQTFHSGEPQCLWKNSGWIKKAGSAFKGWSKFRTGDAQYADGASFSTTASTTLYAVWEAMPITVYFNENWTGGGETARQYVPGNMYGTFPPSPKRQGYDFIGWFNKAGTEITTTFAVPDGDTILYARWKPRATSMMVSFMLNDGSSTVFSEKTYSVVPGTPTYYGQMPEPERDGWSFGGWYTESSGGEKVNSYSQVQTGRSRLYAHWLKTPAESGIQMIPVYTRSEPDWPVVDTVALPAMIYGEFSTHDDVGWFSRNNVLLYNGFATDGWTTIRFNSESSSTKVLSLALWGDDNNWGGPIGSVVECGSFQVCLQSGSTYAFCITLTDRETGDEACDREPAIMDYDIQIGGSEPLAGGLNTPPTPEVSVVDEGIRVAWAPMREATEYHLYRHSYEEVSASTYDWVCRCVAIVDGTHTDYIDNEINNDGIVNYSLKAVVDGEIGMMGGESEGISLEPYFIASANESQFSYAASSGSIAVDSNLKWNAHAESVGGWLRIEGPSGDVNGSRSISFYVDENTTSQDRTGYVHFIKSSASGWPRGISSVAIVQRGRGAEVSVVFMEKTGAAGSSGTYMAGEAFHGLPVPERAGYAFLGWTTAEDGWDIVAEDSQVGSSTSQLFAQWMPNSYSIRFNANGGSGSMSNEVVMCNAAWLVPQCQFEKTGFVFLGWGMEPDGEAVYRKGDVGDNLTLDDGAVVDLYAIWGDEARYYGPWGYEPEVVKDDVAETTFYNMSFTINGEGMDVGDIVAAYDSSHRLRGIGKARSPHGKPGVSFSLTMNVSAGTPLMFLMWKDGTPMYDVTVADTWIEAPMPGTTDFAFIHLVGTSDTKAPLPFFAVDNGVLTGVDLNDDTDIAIPSGVTSIGERAFYCCSNLTSVTMPSTVTNIGDYAFEYCSRLASVAIPDGVTSIGKGAFYFCYSLTNVAISGGVTKIGRHAFYQCSGLTSVTIPSSVTDIGDFAFESCSRLASVVLGNGVTNIGNNAFCFCYNLVRVSVPDSVAGSVGGAFGGYFDYSMVTLNANGGALSGGRRIMVQKGKAVGALPVPVKTGYVLKGWYTKKSGGTKITAKTKIKKNITCYAQWTAQKYAVKVVKVGKGSVSGVGSKAYKSKVTLKAKAAKGYVFQAWYKTVDGEDVLVSRKAAYSFTVPLYGATYKAVFLTTAQDKAGIGLEFAGVGVGAAGDDALGERALPVQTNVCGVAITAMPIASEGLTPTSVKVAGLPTGLKYDSKKKAIVGTPTAIKTFTAKITVKSLGASRAWTVRWTIVPIPAWACGTFRGILQDETGASMGSFTLTVGKTGKVSGKFVTLKKKQYPFSVGSFKSFADGVLTTKANMKYGAKTLSVEIAVAKSAEGGDGDSEEAAFAEIAVRSGSTMFGNAVLTR